MASRRLFVSVDLPDSLVDPFAAVQAPFAELDGIRPTDPEQAHATLKFLGDVPDEDVPDVRERLDEAVAAAGVAPFEAEIGGLGVFPSFDYITVIWVGFRDGATELTTLFESIEEAMVAAGFDPEDHDFTPHITLARMEHAGAKEQVQELLGSRDPTVGEMTVSTVRLKESTLTQSGPEYETIHEVALPDGDSATEEDPQADDQNGRAS